MTSMTRGPLTPAVYWRRRVFVLGVVAALLLIAVNVVRGNGDNLDAGTVSATIVAAEPTAPASTPAVDGTDGEQKKGRGKGAGRGRPADPAPSQPVYTPPPAPVLVDPVGSCADDDIAVSPYVVGAVAGRTVTITLRLRTISAEACTWRISENHLALKITSDDEEVWASRDCPRKLPKDSVVVRQAVTSTYDLTWNSRLSDVGCPKLTAFAQPGDYGIEVAAYGGEPSSTSFTLATPSAVTPEAPVVEVEPPASGEAAGKTGNAGTTGNAGKTGKNKQG